MELSVSEASDVRAPAYTGLKRYSLATGTLNLTAAQRVISDVWKSMGIKIEPGSSACRGVAERAIKYLVSTGDLAKVGRDSYRAVSWSPIAESPDHVLSSLGKVQHRETGKVLAVREDARGRELVTLNGKTFDVAKLTPIRAPIGERANQEIGFQRAA